MATYKNPIDLIEKEYKQTGEKVRKNYLNDRPLLEGVDEKRFNKVKKQMAKSAKKGELK